MTNPTGNEPPGDPGEDWNYRFAMQVWVVFFLLTLCFALLSYLVTLVRG